ncbi:hypothetical protein [Roseibium algae]|uniref:Uncharacterized protein n=1 Tax=Roseibium algae TaxID=3123038 RepID=A0ABU8TQ26_9HYPH
MQRAKTAVKFLTLLLLLLSSSIPSGFMPEFNANGQITVVLCTSDGLRSVVLNQDGTEVPDPGTNPNDDTDRDDPGGVSGLCAFSVLGASALVSDRLVVSAPIPSRSTYWQLGSTQICPPASVPCIGARAPPLSI